MIPAYRNPLVPNRADPYIVYEDRRYWFTASVPEYDRIEIRSALTIPELASAKPVTVWAKHPDGPMSANVWAPELHRIDGKWYIYFAAGRVGAIFDIRNYVLENPAADPTSGTWTERGLLQTQWDSFALDATSFAVGGQRYLIWAQRDPAIASNSNLYISATAKPWTLRGPQVRISQPELDWECIGFRVNEGPAVLVRQGRVFVSYSASATDANYCLGLLSAAAGSNLLDPASWRKSQEPVFQTSPNNRQFGPGHNSFTVAEDGVTDLLVYHARNYREIEGDPLWNPDRHTRVQALRWRSDGTPDFGQPVADGVQ